jgi:hypothetical protein
MAEQDAVKVARSDLHAAWAVLENLAASFDQIGGAFGSEGDGANGTANRQAFQEALAAYLTPELVKAINEARLRLGKYIADEEAETLAEQIAYWDYAAAAKAAKDR